MYASGAGNGKVDVVILDPHGRKDTVRASIQMVVGKEGTFLVEYVPIDQGLHSVNIFFAGSQIPQSPFGVQVAPRKCQGVLVAWDQDDAGCEVLELSSFPFPLLSPSPFAPRDCLAGRGAVSVGVVFRQ